MDRTYKLRLLHPRGTTEIGRPEQRQRLGNTLPIIRLPSAPIYPRVFPTGECLQ